MTDAHTGMPKIIDLTMHLDDNTPVFPGDPAFHLTTHTDFDSDGYRVSKLEMSLHTGTHVDLPLHYISDAATDGAFYPQSFMGEGILVNCPKTRGEDVTIDDVRNLGTCRDRVVLIYTGWYRTVNLPEMYLDEWPGVDADAVEYLAENGAKAIGVDTPSIDSTAGLASGAPAHLAALKAGMPVYECLMALEYLRHRAFTFVGLPLWIRGAEASPVRAIAIIH